MYRHMIIAVCLFLNASAWIAPDIEQQFARDAKLIHSRSAALLSPSEGEYIVFAHGVAGYHGDWESSRQLAQADAYTQMSKLLGRTELSARSHVEQASSRGVESQISKIVDQVDTSILMKSAITRGYWIEGDSFHLISCLYLNTPIPAVKGDLSQEFEQIELQEPWRKLLASHRELWLGGVGIVEHPDGELYALTLVSSKTIQPAYRQELVLKTKASREVASYISGIAFRARATLTKELQHLSLANDHAQQLTEKFQQSSSQRIAASVKTLNKIGTLKHKLSGRTCALFAKKINEL